MGNPTFYYYNTLFYIICQSTFTYSGYLKVFMVTVNGVNSNDLSSDAGLLLIKEFVSKLGIDKLFVKSFKTNDSALFRYHTDQENLLQMIYTRFLYFHFPANTDIPTIKTVYIIESLKTMIRRAILIASKKLYPKTNCLDFFA